MPLVAVTVTPNDPALVPTSSVNVAVPVAPDAIVKDDTESLPVKPVGWTVANAKAAVAQADELLFLTLIVQTTEAPAFRELLVLGSEIVTVGLASAQVGAATVNVAVPVPRREVAAALVPVALTVKAPATVPAFSVRVAVPLAPEASPVSDVFENVPVKPAGCTAVRLNEAAEHDEELLFFSVNESAVEPPVARLTAKGERPTVGFAVTQGAAVVMFAVPVPTSIVSVVSVAEETETANVPTAVARCFGKRHRAFGAATASASTRWMTRRVPVWEGCTVVSGL